MKYSLRRIIRSYPFFHLPMARRKWERWKKSKQLDESPSEVINQETSVVVDGFPRSGNSFLVALLKVSQASSLKFSHHLHSAAHIKEGVRRNLPTIVILRDPREAVLAYVAYDQNVPLKESLRDWISFYRQVLKLDSRRYIIANFKDFVEDGNKVIVNAEDRFPGVFSRIDHGVDEVQAKEYLKQHSEKLFSGISYSLPSAKRSAVKDRVRPQLDADPCRALLAEALEIYELLGG